MHAKCFCYFAGWHETRLALSAILKQWHALAGQWSVQVTSMDGERRTISGLTGNMPLSMLREKVIIVFHIEAGIAKLILGTQLLNDATKTLTEMGVEADCELSLVTQQPSRSDSSDDTLPELVSDSYDEWLQDQVIDSDSS